MKNLIVKKKFLYTFILIALIFIFQAQAHAWRGELGWTFTADTGITSSVALSENLVLFGDANGKFYAVQRASGNLAWSYSGTNTIVGAPTVITREKDSSYGKVVFTQGDGTITCLSISDGELVWQNLPSEGGGDTIVDGAAFGNGKIYVAKGDLQLHAYNADDGSEEWKYKSDQELRSAPAAQSREAAFGENYVFLGEQNGKFSVINSLTGRRITGGGAGGAVNTPTVNKNHVYFSSWDGSIHKVEITNTKTLWTANVKDPVTTAPEVKLNKVFVGTARGNIAAINADNGEILWQFNTNGGAVTARPVASSADELVFAGGGQGILSILDANTGKLRATFTTDGSILGTPAFGGGVLYLGSADKNLYAIF